MPTVIAPDVLVNASISMGTPPQRAVDALLGSGDKAQIVVSEWVLERTAAMLRALPEFKPDALGQHLDRIRELVTVVKPEGNLPGPDAWQKALLDAAKSGQAERVLTDHPDLLEVAGAEGIEFISTDAWLIERSMPPPPPPPPSA